jgi:hypothetical protein
MMNNFLYVTDIKPQTKPGRQEPLWTILNWRQTETPDTNLATISSLRNSTKKKERKTQKSASQTQTTNKPGETPKKTPKRQDTLHRSSFTCRARGCGRKHPGPSRRWPPHRAWNYWQQITSLQTKRERHTLIISSFLSGLAAFLSLSLSLSLPFLPPSPLQPRLVLQHPVSFFFALLTHKNPCKGKEGDGDGSVSRERRNAKMRGRERRERASKKRERRLGLRTILQVRIGPELVSFSFSFYLFLFHGLRAL